MDPLLRSSLLAAYGLLVACQTGAFVYFATFVTKNLRPYFIEHEMGSDLIAANKVFAYLVTCAVLAGLSFIGLFCSFNFSVRYTTNRLRLSKECCLFCCAFFFTLIVNNALALVAVVLSILIAYYNWGWGSYFDVEGYHRLATNCFGLFGMAVASIVLRGCHYLIKTAISKSPARTQTRTRRTTVQPY